jgi:phage tail sheath protein FI
MANFSISPGVTISEIDNTFLTNTVVGASTAIVGPTVKGPVNVPTLVTSYTDYQSLFGDSLISGSDTYSYFTSIAAYNFFNYGGNSLLVTRVASGSYTSATSNIDSGIGVTSASISINLTSAATAAYTASFNGVNVILSGSSVQDVYNNATSSGVIPSNPSNFYTNTTINSSASFSTPNMVVTALAQGIAGNLYYFTSGSTTTYYTNGANATSFILETLSEGTIMNNGVVGASGSLSLGSKNNVRCEITNVNTGSGTFNLIIRQGNDTTNNKIILETWSGLSLDPNSPKYISKVIGDTKLVYNPTSGQIDVVGDFTNKSRYIRVKQVNYNTPNYLNSNGQPQSTQYTNSIPVTQNTIFNGATGDIGTINNFYETINSNNTQGVSPSDYNIAINLMANKEAYLYNVIFAPGLTSDLHPTQVSNLIANSQNRGDCLFIADLTSYNVNSIQDAITQAQTRDSSYAASYFPWVRVVDPATGKNVWCPASTVIPGVYSYNDKVAAPWFAPAGINRGGLSTVLRTQFKLTQADKDNLYDNNINPLATLPKQGVVVFGQKTLQKAASALDRVNVRRLVIELKSFLRQITEQIVFEQNTAATRLSFLARVTPYLETIQQKQGLYAFKVVMDDANNGPDVIDQNQLIGQIYIQPTRTAEFISLDFILLPTGAQFPN